MSPFAKKQEYQEKLNKLEILNSELKINENAHEMLSDEKEEKNNEKKSPERY